MRLGFRSKVLLVSVIAVVAIGCIMMFHSFTQKQAPKDGNLLTTLLEAPLFISSAEAAQTTTAFPEDEAGISAYVKVSAVDIEKIKAILSEAEQVGDNYIVGITQITNFGGTIGVHLYADTDGWLVAYIGADDQAAKIMQWGDADPKNPQISMIQSTTLEDALYKAGDVAGLVEEVAASDIKYYDFEAPAANAMALFIRTRTGSGTNTMQVELPASYTLYEASYYHFMVYSDYTESGDSELKVDGLKVSYLDSAFTKSDGVYWRRAFGSYKGTITTGALQKIGISYAFSSKYTGAATSYSAGVATALIYKAQ